MCSIDSVVYITSLYVPFRKFFSFEDHGPPKEVRISRRYRWYSGPEFITYSPPANDGTYRETATYRAIHQPAAW